MWKIDGNPAGEGVKPNYAKQEKAPHKALPSEIEEHETAETPDYNHESSDLFSEDVLEHLAGLQEVSASTPEVTTDDIQIGDPNVPITSD